MGLRDVAKERQREGKGVLGGGDGVRFGGVGDDDAAARRGRDVDVVDAGAGAADHLEVGGALDQLGGHLGRRADQDRVVGADRLGQLLVRHLEPEVDIEVLPQQIDAGVGDLLLDQDLHAGLPPRCRPPNRCRRSGLPHRPARPPGTCRPAAGCGRACGRARRRRCRWRAGSRRSAAASTESSKSIVPTTSERLAGSATKGVAKSDSLGPAVEVARRGRGALHAAVEAAAGQHPLDLIGEQDQGGERGRVVGLLLARVVERRLQREEAGLPAVRPHRRAARSARSRPG